MQYAIIFHTSSDLHLHLQSLQNLLFASVPQQSPPSKSQASLLFMSSQNPSLTHSGFPPSPVITVFKYNYVEIKAHGSLCIKQKLTVKVESSNLFKICLMTFSGTFYFNVLYALIRVSTVGLDFSDHLTGSRYLPTNDCSHISFLKKTSSNFF